MNNGLRVGFRRGLKYNFGILVGLLLIYVLCAAFSAVLFAFVPGIALPMKIAGSAYMAWLAFRTVVPAKKGALREHGYSFGAGILLQFINIKVIITGLTAFSAYILPSFSAKTVLLAFVSGMSVNAFCATCAWAATGSLLSGVYQKHRLPISLVMAGLLVYCIVTLFV
jgi:threonine/homoserine/homoserine lactone efflux protein